MAYLLDTNVFIQANNLHYGMDFCPAFWDWLVKANEEKQLFSIEKVNDELKAIDDSLSEWSKKRSSQFFLPPDKSIFKTLSEISNWINKKYEPIAVHTFLQGADYYLVAQAKANNHTIVTHEKLSDSKKKIQIPNVCVGLNIKCITPYEMLRSQRVRFILKE